MEIKKNNSKGENVRVNFFSLLIVEVSKFFLLSFNLLNGIMN